METLNVRPKSYFRAARYNPFKNISDIAYLEEVEQSLLDQYESEGRAISYELNEKLFYLYFRLWELEPEKDFYKNSITKFVLALGWDMKRRKVNYEQAQMFFEDLIKLAKPRTVPIAHYRLGFIYFYNKNYPASIRSLESALRREGTRIPEKSPLPHEKLDESQAMRAQSQLAQALAKYSLEAALKAKEMYEQLGKPDDYDIDYIVKLEQEILEQEQMPYSCLSPNGRSSLSEQELRELRHDLTAFIFDCTDHDENRVFIKGRRSSFSPRKMQILEILFRKQRPVPQREISEELGISQVSRYMNDLKRSLVLSGLEEQVIVAEDGYRINHPNPILIYNAYDPQYIM